MRRRTVDWSPPTESAAMAELRLRALAAESQLVTLRAVEAELHAYRVAETVLGDYLQLTHHALMVAGPTRRRAWAVRDAAGERVLEAGSLLDLSDAMRPTVDAARPAQAPPGLPNYREWHE
jgi:hypothetical protein